MVPLISAFSGDHQLALGTSLCAMVGPSAISLRTHMKLGNVARGISLPLALGSGIFMRPHPEPIHFPFPCVSSFLTLLQR